MPVKPLKVELLARTPDALALIYAAFRQCYHAGFVAESLIQSTMKKCCLLA